MDAFASQLAEITEQSLSLPVLPAKQSSQINAYLTISANWLSLAENALPLLTAIACLPASLQQPQSKLWRRHIALYLLLGMRSHANHHTLQQGVAALLSFYQLKQAQQPPAVRQKVAAQLRKLDQHYWAFRLLSTGAASHDSDDVFALSWQWIALLHRSPAMCVADTLHHLSLRTGCSLNSLLTPFVAFPGVLHEGCRVKYQQSTALLVGQLPEQVLLYLPHNEQFAWDGRNSITPENGKTVSLTQWVQIVERLNHYQTENDNNEQALTLPDYQWAVPTSYPVSRPPTSLEQLLRALNDPDVAIKKIVDLISTEPTFSAFLTQAASQDNRMQLPVQDLKQSILTYGLDRVGHMLVQHALYQRLSQHPFPLQPWFSRLTQLAAQIASELAAATPSLTPQSAGLVVTIALSPLFTLPYTKVQITIPRQPRQLFNVATLLHPQPEKWLASVRQHQQSLVTAWQQQTLQTKLIACCGRLPLDVPASLRQAHCVAGLSIIWARQWLLDQPVCESTKQFIQQTRQLYPDLFGLESLIRSQVSALLACPLNEFASNRHSANK